MLRAAEPADAAAIARVEAASWPAALAASEAQILARVQTCPEGQLVAILDGELVGYAAAQRVTQEFLHAGPLVYDRLTDSGTLAGSHDPQGEIYQLIGVGVSPAGRGHRLGRVLVDRQLELARATAGIRRILGFTRPAGYHRHGDIPIDEYVARRDDRGKRIDPVLSFHLDAGARLVSIHPQFRPADRESRGYGVLIEYLL
jgi:GNAT superfamily N-acetyltransferase